MLCSEKFDRIFTIPCFFGRRPKKQRDGLGIDRSNFVMYSFVMYSFVMREMRNQHTTYVHVRRHDNNLQMCPRTHHSLISSARDILEYLELGTLFFAFLMR